MNRKEIEQLIDEMSDSATEASMSLMGDSNILTLIRKVVAACVSNLKLSDELLNDIKLATTEACTNIIKHAYKFDCKKEFNLKIRANSKLIVIDLEYHDPDFDPETIPVPNLGEIKEGGLGVFLIRSIMDATNYNTNKQSGKVNLTMVKLFDSPVVKGDKNEN